MCGIAGIAYSTPTRQKRAIGAVKRMMDIQTHRGPDDSGLYSDDYVVLGHRRLAVIDLSSLGRQPISNENGTVWVVYNGEIYNYRELREDLVKCGHVFKSRSDSEVLVHGFEEWGIEELLRKLIGMFAFAIYQSYSKGRKSVLDRPSLKSQNDGFRLILARDRLGKKPLYYAWQDDQLIFASEVRAMKASGLLPNKLNGLAIEGYLAFGSVPSPLTMFEQVEALDSGCYMIVENGKSTLYRYWKPSFVPDSNLKKKDILDQLQQLLEDSVRLRLVSDVPVGVFLSGGIDSTSIVALMHKVSRNPIHTFSLTFQESEYDEADIAERVARRFQTTHLAYKTGPREVLEELPKFFDSMDQPTIDGLNTYLVSKVTREAGTIVALSGVGGDELFGGYPSFRRVPQLYRLARLVHTFPWIGQMAASALSQCSSKWKMNKLGVLLDGQPSLESAYLAMRGLFLGGELASGTPATGPRNMNVHFSSLEYLKNLSQECENSDSFNKVSWLEMRSYLHNQLLRDTDVMGMAHALEIRVPFLDHRLVELIAKIPPAIKMGQPPKSLLLQAVGQKIPHEVWEHPKMGFTLPFDSWFRTSWKPMIEEKLTSDTFSIDGLSENSNVLWKRYLDGSLHWSRIWAVIVLKEWLARQACPESLPVETV